MLFSFPKRPLERFVQGPSPDVCQRFSNLCQVPLGPQLPTSCVQEFTQTRGKGSTSEGAAEGYKDPPLFAKATPAGLLPKAYQKAWPC